MVLFVELWNLWLTLFIFLHLQKATRIRSNCWCKISVIQIWKNLFFFTNPETIGNNNNSAGKNLNCNWSVVTPLIVSKPSLRSSLSSCQPELHFFIVLFICICSIISFYNWAHETESGRGLSWTLSVHWVDIFDGLLCALSLASPAQRRLWKLSLFYILIIFPLHLSAQVIPLIVHLSHHCLSVRHCT